MGDVLHERKKMKSNRRSSILKKSPGRLPLEDLNSNTDSNDTRIILYEPGERLAGGKKMRKSVGRRVSFAEKPQVKEFNKHQNFSEYFQDTIGNDKVCQLPCTDVLGNSKDSNIFNMLVKNPDNQGLAQHDARKDLLPLESLEALREAKTNRGLKRKSFDLNEFMNSDDEDAVSTRYENHTEIFTDCDMSLQECTYDGNVEESVANVFNETRVFDDANMELTCHTFVDIETHCENDADGLGTAPLPQSTSTQRLICARGIESPDSCQLSRGTKNERLENLKALASKSICKSEEWYKAMMDKADVLLQRSDGPNKVDNLPCTNRQSAFTAVNQLTSSQGLEHLRRSQDFVDSTEETNPDQPTNRKHLYADSIIPLLRSREKTNFVLDRPSACPDVSCSEDELSERTRQNDHTGRKHLFADSIIPFLRSRRKSNSELNGPISCPDVGKAEGKYLEAAEPNSQIGCEHLLPDSDSLEIQGNPIPTLSTSCKLVGENVDSAECIAPVKRYEEFLEQKIQVVDDIEDYGAETAGMSLLDCDGQTVEHAIRNDHLDVIEDGFLLEKHSAKRSMGYEIDYTASLMTGERQRGFVQNEGSIRETNLLDTLGESVLVPGPYKISEPEMIKESEEPLQWQAVTTELSQCSTANHSVKNSVNNQSKVNVMDISNEDQRNGKVKQCKGKIDQCNGKVEQCNGKVEQCNGKVEQLKETNGLFELSPEKDKVLEPEKSVVPVNEVTELQTSSQPLPSFENDPSYKERIEEIRKEKLEMEVKLAGLNKALEKKQEDSLVIEEMIKDLENEFKEIEAEGAGLDDKEKCLEKMQIELENTRNKKYDLTRNLEQLEVRCSQVKSRRKVLGGKLVAKKNEEAAAELDLIKLYQTAQKFLPWSFISWSASNLVIRFTNFNLTVGLEEFGNETIHFLELLKSDAKIKSINFEMTNNSGSCDFKKFVAERLHGNIQPDMLYQKYPTAKSINKVLHELSLVVTAHEELYKDLFSVYAHNNLSIQDDNILLSKFISPPQILCTEFHVKCNIDDRDAIPTMNLKLDHVFGNDRTELFQGVLQESDPGPMLFSRVVKQIKGIIYDIHRDHMP